MGKIALNEWPLFGARIASLKVRKWAKLLGIAGLPRSTFGHPDAAFAVPASDIRLCSPLT